MSREIDRRDFSVNKVTPARETELHSRASDLPDRLPGAHRVRIASFDATTGNPAVIISESAPAEEGNYVQRGLDYVQRMIWLLESDVMDRRRDLQEQRHRDLDISETRAKTFIEEAKRRLNA